MLVAFWSDMGRCSPMFFRSGAGFQPAILWEKRIFSPMNLAGKMPAPLFQWFIFNETAFPDAFRLSALPVDTRETGSAMEACRKKCSLGGRNECRKTVPEPVFLPGVCPDRASQHFGAAKQRVAGQFQIRVAGVVFDPEAQTRRERSEPPDAANPGGSQNLDPSHPKFRFKLPHLPLALKYRDGVSSP